ncbi:MAG: glycosyltransferase family 9 protein [Planctomycetota bacterium]
MTAGEKIGGDRILCIRMSGLGDVVHALNALTLLRRERPTARIDWVVGDRFAGLLRGHPYVENLVVVPRRRWGGMLKSPLRWTELSRRMKTTAARLSRAGYAASVDFQSSLKSAWLVRAAQADLRIGFARPVNRELNFLMQNRLVEVPAEGVHRIERDIALLRPLGIAPRYAPPVLPGDPSERRAVDRMLNRLPGTGPLVVIHPGTSRFAAFKRWLPDRYAEVGDHLVAERKADVLVTWGPEDRPMAREVADRMQRGGTLSPPTESLRRYAELLRRADLFIGSDTGPMHLASALGIPVVALFGPKDPEQTGPYCSRSIVVTGRADCRPCDRRKCTHVRCMTSITVGQVRRAALDVLDGAGRCPARQRNLPRVLDQRPNRPVERDVPLQP